MNGGHARTIIPSFLVSLVGSLIGLGFLVNRDADNLEEWRAVVCLAWWPLFSLVFSVFLIQRVSKQFKTYYAETTGDLSAWRAGAVDAFASMACIITAVVLGATPQLWWLVKLWPSKGVLMVPLGVVLFLHCLVTAWAITVFTSTIANAMRIGTIVAQLMFAAAFLGNWILFRFAGGFVALPYLGGNRIDAFSPLMLYFQRFRFDRPVSRLHLMYASSLTMFALGCMVLLLVSFLVAFGRSRRAARTG